MLEQLLPLMQAVQRAWRNKYIHVQDRIIPAESKIDEEIAAEVFAATNSLMRKLAADLPV